MLDPQERVLLMEGLRPPPGYSLDEAIGTTYSLDLMALLVVPLSFTRFQAEERDGRFNPESMALLESLRRHAANISLFCQAGQIHVPGRNARLLGYLEGCVHGVSAPDPRGIFHPKIWVLRFVAPEGLVRYRVLVNSRNLTFDTSWDTSLCLEGELKAGRVNAFSSGKPLSAFLEALPGMAVNPLPSVVLARLGRFQDEVRFVDFEVPEGFEKFMFVPMGHDGRGGTPFPENDRPMLVASPFLSEGMVDELRNGRSDFTLISQATSLDAIATDWRDDEHKCYVFSQVTDHTDLEKDPEGDSPPSEVITSEAEQLSGLHAKLFVLDEGWNTVLWTGSANATRAAFHHNVEFLVELRGKKSRCGIDALLGVDEKRTDLFRMLEEYSPPAEAPEPDLVKQALEETLETARRTLAAMPLRLVLHSVPETTEDLWNLALHGPGASPPEFEGVKIAARPVTLPPPRASAISPAEVPWVAFPRISEEAISAFMAFELSAQLEGTSAALHFVLRLPLDGAPPDRLDRILRSLLGDRSQVEQFLLMLLGSDDEAAGFMIRMLHRGESAGGGQGPSIPLLETLLRTLHRDPERLRPVLEFVEQQGKTEEGRRLLPEGLDRILPAIAEALGTAGK